MAVKEKDEIVETEQVEKESEKVKVMFLINVRYQDQDINKNGICDVLSFEADEFVESGIAQFVE